MRPRAARGPATSEGRAARSESGPPSVAPVVPARGARGAYSAPTADAATAKWQAAAAITRAWNTS